MLYLIFVKIYVDVLGFAEAIPPNSNFQYTLYSRHYNEACNECGIDPRGITPEQHRSEETLQQWKAIGDTVSDLTGPEIKPKTFQAGSKNSFTITPNVEAST